MNIPQQSGFGSSDFDFGEDPWYSKSPAESPKHEQYAYQQPNIAYSVPMDHLSDEDFGNEPPLLEELGIRFDHIWSKTQAVIVPSKNISEHILDDADLAGPLFYCLLLGSALLLSGKVHFGYIYGFSIFGCVGMYAIINLIHPAGLDFWRTCSVLGYCMLPIIALAALGILLSMKGILGFILAAIAIAWSTYASTSCI